MNMNQKKSVNYSKQHGATMWTTLSVVLMVGFLAMIAFKLIPIYLDHAIIRGSMQEIVNGREFRNMSTRQIMTSMDKRMTIDNIRGMSKDAFKVKKEKSGERYIVINYSQKVSIISNVSALVEFNEEVRTKRN